MLGACIVITYSKKRIKRVRLPILPRGQLIRADEFFPVPVRTLRIWSRETGLTVPSRVSLLIPHTQAESGAYLRDSSRVPRRRSFIYSKPPDTIGSFLSL